MERMMGVCICVRKNKYELKRIAKSAEAIVLACVVCLYVQFLFTTISLFDILLLLIALPLLFYNRK